MSARELNYMAIWELLTRDEKIELILKSIECIQNEHFQRVAYKSWDGGSPGSTGSACIFEFRGHFFGDDDVNGLAGPFQRIEAAADSIGWDFDGGAQYEYWVEDHYACLLGCVPSSLIVHVPHASVEIPEDTVSSFSLGSDELEREILRMTDLHTDSLAVAAFRGASIVRFPVSRLIVDPERFEDDGKEPMAAKGMGVIYLSTADLRPLRKRPSAVLREELLARFYRPH